LPNVPTTTELGLPAVYSESNYGIIAATALPAAMQQKMRDALVTVLNTPAVKNQIATLGAVAVSTTADEYRKIMQQESIKWAEVIKKGQITLQ
jgi:tripartite-type tricarboxylate transporter receptor subunit TctC